MSSCRSSKEGDLPLCILKKREILRETISRHLFRPSTFKFRLKFWKWWDIPSFEWLKTLHMPQNLVFLYLVDTLLTKQCIFIGKFNTISSFNEKIIGTRWGQKRGSFPVLGGGGWMFRREMGSKRGSLPPKEVMGYGRRMWRCEAVRLAELPFLYFL